MTTGNHGRSLLVASPTDYLHIQLLADTLLLFDRDAVLGDILLSLFQRGGCQVLEYFQLVFAFANDGS